MTDRPEQSLVVNPPAGEAVAGEAPLVAGDPSDYTLKAKQMVLEAGWLGHVFGTSSNAPVNIAGLVLFLFTITILVLIIRSNDPVADSIKIMIPIVTLSLGYLFGRKM